MGSLLVHLQDSDARSSYAHGFSRLVFAGCNARSPDASVRGKPDRLNASFCPSRGSSGRAVAARIVVASVALLGGRLKNGPSSAPLLPWPRDAVAHARGLAASVSQPARARARASARRAARRDAGLLGGSHRIGQRGGARAGRIPRRPGRLARRGQAGARDRSRGAAFAEKREAPLVALVRRRTSRAPQVPVLRFGGDADRGGGSGGEPIEIGPGNVFVPLVIGPASVPFIDDVDVAERDPELAVLSFIAHGNEAPAEVLGRAALLATLRLSDERQVLYSDLVFAALSEAARAAL